MLAGFARVDITPPLTQKPVGSVAPRVMAGVHDPLLACAAVVDDGKTTIALVGIDAGAIERGTFESAAAIIRARTGIPAENLVVSASHTHAGGRCISTFNAVADPDYGQQVARGVADAVVAAWQHRAPAQWGSVSASVSGIHFNRRFLMRDGRQVTHPGKLHPDIVAAAGPVDDKVSALVFRKPGGEPLGVVANFACHCTVTEEGNEYSADYVYYLREHLKRLVGCDEVVFLQGACGDVTQIDNLSADIEKGQVHAEKMGQTMTAALTPAIKSLAYRDDMDIAVCNRTVSIPVRDRDYCGVPTLGLGSGDLWNGIYRREHELVGKMREASPAVACRVNAVRLGDMAIVTNGGELFAQPALDIQRASPFGQTWTVTLANEYIGYIPTATAHHAGGYEPRLARSSHLAVEAAQRIVETSLGALRATAVGDADRRLHDDANPAPPAP